MTPFKLLVILILLAALLGLVLTATVRAYRKRDAASASKAPRVLRKSIRELPFATVGTEPPTPVRRKRQINLENALESPLDKLSNAQSKGIYADVEAKLEQAFEGYAEGRIGIATYQSIVKSEEAMIERARSDARAKVMVGLLSAEEADAAREDIERAAEAVRWCKEWAQAIVDRNPLA